MKKIFLTLMVAMAGMVALDACASGETEWSLKFSNVGSEEEMEELLENLDSSSTFHNALSDAKKHITKSSKKKDVCKKNSGYFRTKEGIACLDPVIGKAALDSCNGIDKFEKSGCRYNAKAIAKALKKYNPEEIDLDKV